ncbi:MAG: type II-A CRISPR-associated protein Csn2, partial [Apilactobacillus sp.]|nr:type II-A CRISPR-associated protein Csn2 [Apilactobacillus sp.]
YIDILNGLKDRNDLIKIYDGSYNELDKSKYIDFYGDLINFDGLVTKQINGLVKKTLDYLDNDDINYIQKSVSQLNDYLQEKLFMIDLPLKVTKDVDIKKVIKNLDIHLDSSIISNPYDILEMLIRLKVETNSDSIIVINNLANYLDDDQLRSIQQLCKESEVSILDIEFNSDCIDRFNFCQYYFIDNDFVDWYN